MMKVAFFLPNFSSIFPVRRRHQCLRQHRPILVCARTPPNSENIAGNSEEPTNSNKPEDPEWMKLAESIVPESAKRDPVRPPPQWTYPEGDPRDVGDQNPWVIWNAAQSTEQDITLRDPKAETDFWRSTAREMIGKNTETCKDDVSTNLPDEYRSENIQPKPNSDNFNASEKIWTMARGVTGEMTSLQNRLREELDQYDPEHNRDQYRDIARELVGPEDDEPWEGNDPVRSLDDVSTSAGWNPDVDWMRFDDIRRENIMAEEAAKRRSVEDAARQNMLDALNTTAKDENFGNDITSDPDVTVDGKIPNFLANRFRSDGTYGSGWSGAQREMDRLKSQGFELRDSKMDTDQWRSTARELIGEEATLDPKGDAWRSESSAGPSPPPLWSDENVDQVNNDADGGDERNLWSAWRSGDTNWKRANENVEQRNPKKEVDIWRSSARELLSSDPVDHPVDESSSTPKSQEASKWAQWRQANSQWEEGLFSNELDASGDSSSQRQWLENGRVDWGAGLGKTNSERSAWDNWNRVAGQVGGDDANMWWSTRHDGSVRADRSRSDQDVPLVNDEKEVTGSREERLGNDTALQAWRSMAKEIEYKTEGAADND